MGAVTPARFIDRPALGAHAWLAALNARDAPRLHAPDPATRMVLVAPHPDDETLLGGLACMHACQGGQVAIVAVSDGEACFGRLDDEAAASLRQRRRAERSRAMACLGFTQPAALLGLPDGAVATHEPALRQALIDGLRPSDTVITTFRFDGHPDHEACGRVAAACARQVGARVLEAPVWMFHWAHPDHREIDWSALRAWPLTAAVRARKQAALRCHASQYGAAGPGREPVLDDELLRRSQWPVEFYFEGTA